MFNRTTKRKHSFSLEQCAYGFDFLRTNGFLTQLEKRRELKHYLTEVKPYLVYGINDDLPF